MLQPPISLASGPGLSHPCCQGGQLPGPPEGWAPGLPQRDKAARPRAQARLPGPLQGLLASSSSSLVSGSGPSVSSEPPGDVGAGGSGGGGGVASAGRKTSEGSREPWGTELPAHPSLWPGGILRPRWVSTWHSSGHHPPPTRLLSGGAVRHLSFPPFSFGLEKPSAPY